MRSKVALSCCMRVPDRGGGGYECRISSAGEAGGRSGQGPQEVPGQRGLHCCQRSALR